MMQIRAVSYTHLDVYKRQVQDLRTNEIQLQFNEKELHELFALYAEELKNANFNQLIHEHMVGELSVVYSSAPEKDVFTTEYFTIYDSFDSVIEYLKKAGFELNQSYRPEEILSITVETYKEADENVNREIITDSEQIHRLFPYLNKYAFGTIWYESDAFVQNMMLSVVWKDGSTSNYELRVGGEEMCIRDRIRSGIRRTGRRFRKKSLMRN